eukprot:1194702-Prorocentrum_minimum.AAC.3
MVNSTVSVKNWRENWLNKVFMVNSTASVKNSRENWLNKVFMVNSTASRFEPYDAGGRRTASAKSGWEN